MSDDIKEISNIISNNRERLARIETKLDVLCELQRNLSSHINDLRNHVNDEILLE